MWLLLVACTGKPADVEPVPTCEAPTPPAEATLPAGDNGGVFVLPDGRLLTPTGMHVEVGGFPADVAVVRGGAYAVVTNAHRSERALDVVDLADGTLVTQVVRADAFPGLAVAPDGVRVYASGGNSGLVDVYDVGDDGSVTAAGSVAGLDYPAGLALSADGARLFVAQFGTGAVAEVDTATLSVTRTFPVDFNPFDVVVVEATGELYASGFGDTRVSIVDLASGAETGLVEVGGNPAGLAVSADGGRVFVAVSNEDRVDAIDTSTGTVVASAELTDAAIAATDTTPLPGTSPSALVVDPASGRLYVTRAADNAVVVLDGDSLAPLGAVPVGWYPTGVALTADGATLVTSNGKGVGTGPNDDGTFVSDAMVGTVSIVPLDDAALPGWTATVADNLRHPDEVYPFDCVGTFPVPRAPGDPTPIEHVVLIVRENKTYDSLLGDLEGGNGDPALAYYGRDITPNLHALAERFTSHDNFYTNSESSVQGHLWLTSSFVSEYMERAWIEDYHGVSTYADDSATEVGRPSFGTIFTHLIHHGVSMVNYGEIVGALDTVDGIPVMASTDLAYPGGFFNTDVPDIDKANYAADRLLVDGDFPSFVYLLLPNDHTNGTSAGSLTPEAMINDNDFATGTFVDRLSHSPYWENTVVFVVEDDPQSANDHVDAHRSILLVISPWAKAGHTSSVSGSFPSVFRTIEAILGVPPMNRYDALATPLWDSFTSVPDPTPFTALPRTVPDETNSRRSRGAQASRCLDLSGPDRNPVLGDILTWHRTGAPPPGSALARGETDCRILNAEREDEPEEDAYDDAWRRFEAWKAAHPGEADHVVRPGRVGVETGDDD